MIIDIYIFVFDYFLVGVMCSLIVNVSLEHPFLPKVNLLCKTFAIVFFTLKSFFKKCSYASFL